MYKVLSMNCNKKLTKQIKFPTGYYITYGGAFENLNGCQTTFNDCCSSFTSNDFILLFLLLIQ